MLGLIDLELNELEKSIINLMEQGKIKYLKVSNTYVEPDTDIIEIENFDEKQYQIPEKIMKKKITMEMEDSEDSSEDDKEEVLVKLDWLKGKLTSYK